MSPAPIEVKVELQGFERLAFALNQGIPMSIRTELRRTIDRMAMELQRHIKAKYLSGQSLKVQSGTLRRSVNIKRIDTATEIIARVGSNVFYGRIWEFTGTPAMTILPKVKKALFWPGAPHPYAKVNKPAVGPKPWLKPAYEDLRSHIVSEIQKTVGRVTQKGFYGGP